MHGKLIWWLSQSDLESLLLERPERELGGLPEYILREIDSMMGRPLRGRLWVSSSFEKRPRDFEVKFELFETIGKHLVDSGGLVFREEDLGQIRDLPGEVTDFELNGKT